MWLKEKMKNMSQGTEQLLFCIYSVVFLIIMLIGFTGDYFIIDLLFFPAFFFTLFWISRLMRLARENKSQFMKKFFIDNGGSLSMLLGLGTLVFDDFFGDYLQPFENSLLNIITYIIIVLLPVSLSIYYRNKK